MKIPILLTSIATAILIAGADGAAISGELRKWHKVTLSFDGPNTSETATPNPFTNYRLNVTFSHAASGKSYLVPGYYAADGNAANTSATSGDVWRVNFAPDETGTWTYSVSFRSGTNVATDASPTAGSGAGFFDGETGNFSIAATNKTGRDFRGKGRLQYVGKHHLRFAETGEYFMKAGVDAPENLLAYSDFDGDFKSDGEDDELVRGWEPHVQDWNTGDPTWQGTKGKGLIGAINYLAEEGLNAFSFLTMNIEGDDKNVFPYTSYSERSRLDVSRLDQWEIIFEHGTRKGMYLHFKTQETENELLLDSGNLGNQRKLYYRELIARFGHNLALNWNLGEEINGASLQQKQAWAQYFYDTDPYHHHMVIHNGATHYNMMGSASKLTGFSLQLNASDFTDNFSMTKDYIDRSVAAGKPWVVATDEPGDSQYALRPDDNAASSHTNARKHAIWGNIMAGGAGVEFYFGYALHDSDLTCNDFRSRDAFWPFCRHAVDFFENNDVPFQDMTNQNSLVSGSGNNANRCLAKPGDTYLIHLPSGGSPTLNLSGQSGSYQVRWLDPRNGGALISGNTISGGGTRSIGSPPNSTTQDWVALIQESSGGTPTNEAPVVSAGSDKSGTLSGGSATVTLNGSASDDGLPAGSTLTRTWTRVSGPGTVSFANASSASTNATFTVAGSYTLRLTASDGDLSSSDDVAVTINSSTATNQAPVANAGPDRSAVLSGSSVQVSLSGSATDDGLPAGSSLTYSWTRVSGPASVSFSSASSAATNATFTATGTYVLRLTVSDSALSDTDDVTVTINSSGGGGTPATFSPTHDAYTENGTNVNNNILRLENTARDRISYLQFDAGSLSGPATSATLRMTQTSDLSSDSKVARVFLASNDWTETTVGSTNLPDKGPQVASFTGSIASGMVLSFDVTSAITGPGTYSFIVEFGPDDRDVSFASSEHATASIRPALAVTTTGGGTPNAAPVVNAGPDQSTSYQGTPATITLSGSASDDGLPQGSSLSLAWTRVSGPSTATIANPSSATTNVTFNEAGNYVFRLTASDGQLSSSDDVAVLVISDIIDNEIPTVSAGPDKIATLTGTSVQVTLDGSASDDGQPESSTLQVTWSRVSGPGSVTFADDSSAVTTATFNTAGTHVLRLTASDGELSDSDDMTVTIDETSGSPVPASFPAIHDAYTENGSNNNNSSLRIENSSRKRIAYLQFDLRSASGSITSASLRLTENDDVSSGNMTLRLHSASSNSWTESGITGSNAPAKVSELASFTGDVTNGRAITFDVSSFVTAPAIYSFILEADPSNLDVSLASSENSTTSARPVLNIVASSSIQAAPMQMSSATVAQEDPEGEDPGAIQAMTPRMTSLETGMEISANGVPGFQYRIERSTDLFAWTHVGTSIAEEDGVVHFADPAPPEGQAFYRIATP